MFKFHAFHHLHLLPLLTFNFILFFLSTWPLTFNLWHLLLKKWIKCSIVSSRNSQVKHKTEPWKFYTLGKLFYEASSISIQEILPSCLQRDTAHQKHGTSLFCNIPELLYKVVEFIPIQYRSFQYIGQTWEPVLYQVCVRYIFAQRYFIVMSNHINFCALHWTLISHVFFFIN